MRRIAQIAGIINEISYIGIACGPVMNLPKPVRIGAIITFPRKYINAIVNVFTINANPARYICRVLAIITPPRLPLHSRSLGS